MSQVRTPGDAALSAGRALLLCSLFAPNAAAQEFTRQNILVAPFTVDALDRAGLRVGTLVHRKLGARLPRAETFLVREDSVLVPLRRAGFVVGDQIAPEELNVLARRARADEIVIGSVRRDGSQLHVDAALLLARDWRRRQPLGRVTAASADAAADSIVRRLLGARTQLTGLRRCENHARTGNRPAAIAEGRRAIALFPESTLARLCVAEVLVTDSAQLSEVRRLAEDVLFRDSTSVVAATLHAQALSGLRVPSAADAWHRVLSLGADSLDLASAAIEQLLHLRPNAAADWLPRLRVLHEASAVLRRQHFRSHYFTAEWVAAAALGDSLDQQDGAFRSDPTAALRLIQSHLGAGDTVRAIARAAESVGRHPTEPSLYVRYADLVQAEQGPVISRGIRRFPDDRLMRVLQARMARMLGDVELERAALTAATSSDSPDAAASLRLAELWWASGQGDSALAALRRAPRATAIRGTVRRTALARGQAMLRVLGTTPSTDSVRLAAAFVVLADSLQSGPDSRALLVVAELHALARRLSEAVAAASCSDAQRSATAVTTMDSLLRLDSDSTGNGPMADLRTTHAQMAVYVTHTLQRLCGEGTGSVAFVQPRPRAAARRP